MENLLLNEIVVILGLSILVLFACLKFRIPAIIGFLFTGIIAGPYGFGLVQAIHEVQTLAEIGVMLLLFTIGIEFSIKDLLKIKRTVLLGGSLQVLLTIGLSALVALKTGRPFGEAIFIGFLVSLSSTAIVLKILQERAEMDSPQGRTSLGILIFQDMVVVPMMLIIPFLAGNSDQHTAAFVLMLLKGIAIIGFVIVSAKWLIPFIFYHITRTRNRELFMLAVVVICLAIAWLTYAMGLSLSLGAFLAGLIISESEYSYQALSNVLPFKDVFLSFFFVSIGMLLDIGFFLDHIGIVVLITCGIVVLKSAVNGFATALLGFPLRIMLLVGFALSQVGEFSFVLSKTGFDHGLLANNSYQMFIAVTIMTMVATPFLINVSPRIAAFVMGLPLPMRLKSGLAPVENGSAAQQHYNDHIIIIGFGINGRNVARAAKVADIPYVVIEMNAETVREEKAEGEPIFYGDATQEAILEHAGIGNARILVITIPAPAATRCVIHNARRLSPKLYIIARTRFIQEVESLYELGADEVIPEEFETSVEIFTRILTRYLLPKDEIERFVTEVRAGGYQMFRTFSPEVFSYRNLKEFLPDIDIVSIRLSAGSALIGKSLAEINLRKIFGVTVLAVRRQSQTMPNPGGDTVLAVDDILFVLGLPKDLAVVGGLFQPADVR